MKTPVWRLALVAAMHRNRSLSYSRYLQLATVRLDGRPANRTVVFRGFMTKGDRLKFVTDTRSQKVIEIAENPWGEACWYFPKTREQFRISGQLTIVEYAEHLCDQSWQELSEAAKSQFFWPDPGQQRRDSGHANFDPPDPIPQQPPPNFSVLLLTPERVDHLQLRGEPQNRTIYDAQSNGTWKGKAVNP
ncbi:pyridoxamine 5'-phosphate oxidase family protein [Limnospira fusiformis KN01]|uniref:Npun_F5749 family FMN-dependent PPOX-type flavoprotein n=1 Tax=Limnospira fusiformis PMC 851.14 TaxID=2219512 RepID=A0ABU9ETV0_LIMFS|nr:MULTISPECIES: Npun_F5749 family FMN-dependent PPOX-type flavoprotein [Limnospira]MDC0839604.1 pyridoxamine 5'-phosphate oxidase family protein [Limnoraphis robusta]MDY7051220.1 pyridoxamine 5'-phosphate oxidase family protein [Limnospira fusiformis LS22]QJB29642.1 pyridoxamine 5'-phosphate oxidase [Limnospira fusiformis SAG 85.79]MDT9190162.1 pyridoxamine 5'-phosphate oxidase family protein [Limnospira sp. PMC 894.15]MDT9200232.1 pyridoxamine 5'-phosphate oxidase family protein [Limnospira 